MRDAFGGLVNIVIIVVFLLIVSGYLAFNVNYTKAFRVKNKAITAFEQYEGNCTGVKTACYGKISEYMQSIGYNAADGFSRNFKCPTGAECGCVEDQYCYAKYTAFESSKDVVNDRENMCYYKIVTQINIEIPILRNILPGLEVFQVAGDTKVISGCAE